MNFADPRTNILQLGLREHMRVADIGAGSGHYTLAAAPLIGSGGRIYAIDIQEDSLKNITDSARVLGHDNIETIWGNAEARSGTKLRDKSMDAVILSNTLFQFERKDRAIEEIQRIIKPDGKVLVIDWAGTYKGIGPHESYVVPEHIAEDLFIGAGFQKVKDFRAGAHHYAIVFTSP